MNHRSIVVSSVFFLACFIFPSLYAAPVKKQKSYDKFFITSVVTDKPVIFLTFDLCPRRGAEQFDEPLYTFLVEENIPAVLFVSGKWLEHNFELGKFLAETPGIYLGGHGYAHERMTALTPAQIAEINKKTSRYISEAAGYEPYLYRVPYADVSPAIKAGSELSGQYMIHYSDVSGDPGGSVKDILRNLKNVGPGSVVIFHLNGRGIHTLEALKILVPEWRAKGFSFGYLPDYLPVLCTE